MLLRTSLAVTPVLYLLARVDPQRYLAAVTQVAWWTVPVILLANLAVMVLQGIRWWLLLRTRDPSLPLRRALAHHFTGIFYSIVLPTSAGQEVVRTALMARETGYARSWGVAWIFRLSGLVSLATFTLLGLSLLEGHGTLRAQAIHAVAITVMTVALVALLSFSKRFTRPIRELLSRIVPPRIMRALEEIRGAIYDFRDMPFVILLTIGMSLLVQLTSLLGTGLTIMGISGNMHLIECFAFFPMIELLCVVMPLTPGGVGIREGLMAIALSAMALDAEQIGIMVAFSVLFNALKLVGGLPTLVRGKTTWLPALRRSVKPWRLRHPPKAP